MKCPYCSKETTLKFEIRTPRISGQEHLGPLQVLVISCSECDRIIGTELLENGEQEGESNGEFLSS